jgi:hypothetical protein
VVGPENKVKVIMHEAPGQQAHGNALAGQRENALKGEEVGLVMKNNSTAIAPIDNVIATTTKSKSKRTRHERKLQEQEQKAKIK